MTVKQLTKVLASVRLENTSVADLEQWVYANDQLESTLGDDYLLLIELDYRKPHALHEACRILERWVSPKAIDREVAWQLVVAAGAVTGPFPSLEGAEDELDDCPVRFSEEVLSRYRGLHLNPGTFFDVAFEEGINAEEFVEAWRAQLGPLMAIGHAQQAYICIYVGKCRQVYFYSVMSESLQSGGYFWDGISKLLRAEYLGSAIEVAPAH